MTSGSLPSISKIDFAIRLAIRSGVGFSPDEQFYRRFRGIPETVTLPLGPPVGGPFFVFLKASNRKRRPRKGPAFPVLAIAVRINGKA